MKSLMAVVLAAGLMAGCAKSSSQQYRIASHTYSAVVEAWADLMDAGVLPMEAVLDFDPLREDAKALLETWEASLLTDGDFEGAALVRHLLDEMIRLRVKAERSRP